jgi:uncharacterized protein YndB with AHSA1/START domain
VQLLIDAGVDTLFIADPARRITPARRPLDARAQSGKIGVTLGITHRRTGDEPVTNTLEASIEIDATPAAVWAVVSDLARMGRWSPQCRKMVIFGGEVKHGTRTLNINKKGPLVWPTSARVIRFEPNTAIAWRVVENHTIWTYELAPTATGTKVTERREAPTGTTKISALLIDKFMGGTADFEVDMVRGMNATLARIKSEVESVATAPR